MQVDLVKINHFVLSRRRRSEVLGCVQSVSGQEESHVLP